MFIPQVKLNSPERVGVKLTAVGVFNGKARRMPNAEITISVAQVASVCLRNVIRVGTPRRRFMLEREKPFSVIRTRAVCSFGFLCICALTVANAVKQKAAAAMYLILIL